MVLRLGELGHQRHQYKDVCMFAQHLGGFYYTCKDNNEVWSWVTSKISTFEARGCGYLRRKRVKRHLLMQLCSLPGGVLQETAPPGMRPNH